MMFCTIFSILLLVVGLYGNPINGIDKRIVNGTMASNAEYPYLVSFRDANTGVHFCSGSILNSRWILTVILLKMCAAKREAWEVEETRFLLRLICAKQVLKPLDRKRFRAADIFQHLEEPMHERRYLKNGKQMQTRFKTFRFQYNRYKRQLNRSGEENCRPDFPFFEEMNVLLGDRPISQLEGVDFAQSSKESNSESDQADYQDAGVTLTNDDLQHDTTDQALEDDDDVQDSEEPTPKRRRYSDKGGRRSYQQHLENYAKIQKHNSLEVQKVVLQKQIESVAELFQQQREFEADLIKKLYGAAERNSGHYCLGLHNNVCNSIGIYFNNT